MEGCARGGPRAGAGAIAFAVSLATLLATPTCAAADAHFERGVARIEVVRHPAASDCPDALTLAALVEKAAGRDAADPPSDASRTVRFDVDFDRTDAGYAGTVHANGALRGERKITSPEPTCSTLAQALALTMTIWVDSARPAPDEAPEVSPPAAAPAPPSVPPAAAEPPPPPAPPAPSSPFDDMPTLPTDDGPLPLIQPPPPGPGPRTALTSLFVEIAGPGVFYSVNYERFVDEDESVRVGVGWISGESGSRGGPQHPWALSVPFVANLYVGGVNHKLQLGAGVTLLYLSSPMLDNAYSPQLQELSPTGGLRVLETLVAGYRYIPKDGGPSIGIAVTPLIGSQGFFPWFAANFGCTF